MSDFFFDVNLRGDLRRLQRQIAHFFAGLPRGCAQRASAASSMRARPQRLTIPRRNGATIRCIARNGMRRTRRNEP